MDRNPPTLSSPLRKGVPRNGSEQSWVYRRGLFILARNSLPESVSKKSASTLKGSGGVTATLFQGERSGMFL